MKTAGRSGFSLIVAGIGGIVFFWTTDPHSGVGRWLTGAGVDAMTQNWTGTVVGIAGSAAALVIGVWLMTRKTV
jgi:hypothetical protein